MKAMTVWIMAAFLLAGCASSGSLGDRQQVSEVYRDHAGSPESYVRYTSIRNWQSVGYDGIVLELNGRRHYFVELTGPCDFDLHSAPRMRLVSAQRHRLSTFDKVVIGEQSCNITGIYKVDMDAVEAELARLRKEGVEPAAGEVEVETSSDKAT